MVLGRSGSGGDYEDDEEWIEWSDEEELRAGYSNGTFHTGNEKENGKENAIKETDEIENGKSYSDPLVAMRIPLLIGTCWGLLPLISFNSNHVRVQCHSWLKVRTLIAITIITLMLINTSFMAVDFVASFSESCLNSIGKVAEKASGVLFYSAGLFVYLFCLIRSPKTCRFFRMWKAMSRETPGVLMEERGLARDMNMIFFFVLVSCAGENILFHVFAMRSGLLLRIKDLSEGRTVTLWDFLEDYFEWNQYVKRFFNYDPFISALLLLTNKACLFACNFGDVFLIMISRALYERFRNLNQFLEQRIDFHGVPSIRPGSVDWPGFRKKFFVAVKLLEEADKLIFPLLWVSYATNIFFVCNQLYLGIRQTEIRTPVHRAYVTWSFLHLALRTLAVNVFGARIHEYAHGIQRQLQFCPQSDYSSEVRRLERYLGGRVIGMTANGVFVITRSFILMMISAIFTLEWRGNNKWRNWRGKMNPVFPFNSNSN